MKPPFHLFVLAGLFGMAGGVWAMHELSENDYFSELPEVLTVTRLAQPLSETPGAVTIIDRETIRRSGAREVADVLRLVPGYVVYGWNGANSVGSYHAALDDYGIRNQVLVDGRSVYSSFYLGNTHRGMLGIVLEDIERIEVLRGSNSATYGANAFLGVINIVTRHAADTHGVMLSVTSGDEGVKDNVIRYGWGTENANFRLTTSRQSDNGYRNVFDDKTLSQLHFRGDLRPTPDSDVLLTAGIARHAYGEGFATSGGNPLRTVTAENTYVSGAWKKALAPGEELHIDASFVEEAMFDRVAHGTLPGVMLDYSGRGRRWNAGISHSGPLAANLRAVWGVTVHHETAESVPLYYDSKVAMSRYQLFGNFEWRPYRHWVVNAGGLWEKHSHTGWEFAPRLAVNHHLADGHTLRAGVTRAFRAPTLFEQEADVRYFIGGVQVGRTQVATGGVRAESVETRELGYLAEIPQWRIVFDMRAFEERLKGIIRHQAYSLLPALPLTGTVANDYVNYPGFHLRGIEYQARWKPFEGTEIWLNQAFLKTAGHNRIQDSMAVPRHVTTLALFQRLASGVELTAVLYGLDTMSHRNPVTDMTDPSERLDLRLAYPFRIGSTRVEVAVTVQAANGGYPVYLPSNKFEYDRRTFGTLRVAF